MSLRFLIGRQNNVPISPSRSFLCDGSAYIRVPYSASIGMVDELTVGCWIKPSWTLNNPGIITRNAYTAHRVWGLEGWADAFLAMVSQPGNAVTKGWYYNDYNVNDGRWHFIAWTYTSQDLRLYQDEVRDSTPGLLTDNAYTGDPSLLSDDATVDLMIGGLLSSGTPSDFLDGDTLIYRPFLVHKACSTSELGEIRDATLADLNLSTTSVAAQVVLDYRFDSSDTAEAILDQSGNGNTGVMTNGTLANFVSNVPGYLVKWNGWHLNFNGTNQHVTVAHSASLDLTTDITVLIAFKYTDTSSEQVLFSKADYGANLRSWFIEKHHADRTKVSVFLSKNGSSIAVNKVSTRTVNDGQWHTFGFTISGGGDIATYLDGELDTTDNLAGSLFSNNTVPVMVGGIRNSGNAALLFNGLLDEPRIFDVALTAAQVKELHRAIMYNDVDTMTLDSAGDCVLSLRLGDDDQSQASIFTDQSGDGNDGTGANLTTGSYVQGP